MKKNVPPHKTIATGPASDLTLPKDVQRRIETGRMDTTEIVKCAEGLKEKGDMEACVAAYQLWVRGSKDPHRYLACFNLGVTLSSLGRLEEELEAYELALAARPIFPEALLNIGLVLERLGEPKKAIEKWRILAYANLTPEQRCVGLNQVGRMSEILGIYDQATEALALSLQLKPKQTNALQHWLRVRQKRCLWPTYGELPGHSKCDMLLATSPMAMLGESDNAIQQLYCARALALKLYPAQESPLSEGRSYSHRRLRIGYLSSDFNIHAVGLLLAELFECHDLSRFETFGFCVSKDDHSEHRQRLIAAFEHFEHVRHLSDEQIARRILEHEIDVLIDLNGVSSNTRIGVLSFRPAPVQATWLGYIGTTALPWVDHVIADRIALPEKLADFFTEKPLYLSHSFLPFDSKQAVLPTLEREAQGLPPDKFVFASFNNVTKLNPKMCATWLRILKRVPDSILWLVDDNPWATANLKDFAAQHGIPEERLVFAPRLPYGIHLARVPNSDLFLDNHPYNAGSTANDTLRMGVPLLTLAGETFVSRMGYSVLHELGLPELVTFSHQEYEDRAVELATNRTELAAIRQRLLTSTARRTRENCITYTRDLERLFWEATGHTPPSKVHSVVVRSLRNTNQPLCVSNEFQLVALSTKRELQLLSAPLPTPDFLKVDPGSLPNFHKAAARTLSFIPRHKQEPPEVVFNVVSPPTLSQETAKVVFHFISSESFSPSSTLPPALPAPSQFTEGRNRVITPSAWSRDRLVRAGMQPERVFVVPFGVDRKTFYPFNPTGRAQVRTQMGIGQDEFVITHVGSMSQESGGDLLLRAFAELHRENSKVRLLLRENSFAPEGSVQQAIESVHQSHPGLITNNTIASLLSLPSAVSLQHAHFFYGISDVYVAPFRSESFHGAALEAIACGLTVLITEGGSADGWMRPGICTPIPASRRQDAGKAAENPEPLLEPDYEQLLKQLRQAMKRPVQSFHEADREQFLEKWSWEIVADKLVNIVQSALASVDAEVQEQ